MNHPRNYQKIKTIDDFRELDSPVPINVAWDVTPTESRQMVLRMLVKPKYGDWKIPDELFWLKDTLMKLHQIDTKATGILESNCYVTVRHGIPESQKDDEWHFDGASFRVDTIPERNYILVSHTPTEYKSGKLDIPEDFDPLKHDLFHFAAKQLKDAEITTIECNRWYLLNPFCLHRRNPNTPQIPRTFIRVSFVDIEIRDVNNTQNSLLPTPAFGRDPVHTFRNKLIKY
jgi:hypothetical protein